MSDAEEVKFSLKVMVNKAKTKVLFAESDSHFVDVLLSFLTLPLGKIMKVMKEHYNSEAPSFGCLNALYSSVEDLDGSHFWTKGAKQHLLDPMSSLSIDTRRLKLEVIDSNRALFSCVKCPSIKFWSESIYYDIGNCKICGNTMLKKVAKKLSQAQRSGGVFTLDTTSFVITDDLRIMPNATGLVETLSTLHITGTNGLWGSVMASMISQTPLSDLFLRRKSNSRKGLSLTKYLISCYGGKLKAETSLTQTPVKKPTMFAKAKEDFSGEILAPLLLNDSMILWETAKTPVEKEETPESKKMILKVMVQKSTNRLLFARAKEDFVEFLFSLLAIPIGGLEWLLATKTSTKSIDNLYRSVTDLIDDEYFKSLDIKEKLIKPKLPHGYISQNHILPLPEERLPSSYQNISLFSSVKFPQGQGKYIKGSRVYHVMDDLTVKPFSVSSILSSLSSWRIPVSDVKELEMEIGMEEAWSILKASLTSDSALTNALMNRVSMKQTKA